MQKIKKITKNIALGWNKSFEKKAKKMIEKNSCDWIICWHLHQAEDKQIGKYHYLNSGDRVESCTALVENKNNQRKLIKT